MVLQKLRGDFMDAWGEAGLDGIICPPCPLVATKHGSMDILLGEELFFNQSTCVKTSEKSVSSSLTSEWMSSTLRGNVLSSGCNTNLVIYNLLDTPAGVVPVSKVTKMDTEKLKDTYEPLGNFGKCIIQVDSGMNPCPKWML